MSPLWGHIIGVITLVFMATFLGIWIWAWRKEHKATFSRLAQMPMRDAAAETPPAEDDEEST